MWLRGRTLGSLGDGAVVRRLPPVARRLAARRHGRHRRPAPLPGPSSRALLGTVHDDARPAGATPRRPATVADACAASDASLAASRGSTGCRPPCGAAPDAGRRPLGAHRRTPVRWRSRPTRPGWPTCSPRRRAGPSPSPWSGRSTAPSRSPSTSPTALSTSVPRRHLVRERGMTARSPTTGTSWSPCRCSAPTVATRPSRRRSAGRRRRRRPAPRRRRSACSPPSAPASPPGGPALLPRRRRRRSPRRRPTTVRCCPSPPRPAGLASSASGRCSRTSGCRGRAPAGGGCRPTCWSGCCAATARDAVRRARRRGLGGPLAAWLVEHQPDLRPSPAAAAPPVDTARCPASPCRRRCSPLLTAPPEPVVAAVARRPSSTATFGRIHRAVLVNFVARSGPTSCRRWPWRCAARPRRPRRRRWPVAGRARHRPSHHAPE